MNRRTFLATLSAAPLLADEIRSKAEGLKITSVGLVKARQKRPRPEYTPRAGSYWTQRIAARPMSIYPKYNGPKALWEPDGGGIPVFTVEIGTNQGITGLGQGGPGGGYIVEQHLKKLLMGENPLDIEMLWDIMWRSTLYYGRKGAVIHAISGVDLALWDLMGKFTGLPVWRLLGGRTRERVPAYATGNDIDQSAEFGFKKVKLALPYGPAEGKEGIRKNVDLIKRTRATLGPDGHIMLDCWMALTEEYTLQLAEAVAPYDVYWIEEALPPDDYEGYGRLNAAVRKPLIVTGEHHYTRYDFRQLVHHNAARIWQPDIQWCGGLSELRRIGALASSYDIPVIPHGGGLNGAIHYIVNATNSPWAELALPAPGGPEVVYKLFEEEKKITRGPEGVYMAPPSEPGMGWQFEAG
ncbi:MAG: enolase C-terminal domain-like protein [Bryobacteraceae bacterium]|nr:enolase C-terminal domain-like protein [Bryobacteraceae bacterium]